MKKNKLDELQEKLKKIENSKNNHFKSNKRGSGAAFGFKISTEIIAALVVGVGIGLIVDKYLNTKPFGLIIFFVLGAFAGFFNVFRVIRRIERQ
ncbi:MAG: ATPase F0F1 [Pelagibacteraceae bacterium]|nr:ATPase F0F1 [Pelagibacteraceae bacterium]|tara:strand:- start:34147 stop:34428 length:282 start_codon:yes stop_codon:yes gene_type:complete